MIDGPNISFLAGGSGDVHPGRVGLFVIDRHYRIHEVLGSDRMDVVVWNVEELMGNPAYIVIVDHSGTGSVSADRFCYADAPLP